MLDAPDKESDLPRGGFEVQRILVASLIGAIMLLILLVVFIQY